LAYAASFEDGGEIAWTPVPNKRSQWEAIDNDSDMQISKGGAW
jgi:hypothetical protein